MKTIFLFICAAILSTMGFAQTAATIDGTVDPGIYTKIVLYKVLNGRPVEVASAVPDGQQRFAFRFTPEYEGVYLLGTPDIVAFANAYPFYFKGGEQLQVRLSQGNYALIESSTEENRLFSQLYQTLKPLENKAVYRAGLSTYVDFFPQVEQISGDLPSLKQARSGNPVFDKFYPRFVDYSFANLAIGYLYTPRTAHPSEDEFTAYYRDFDPDMFLGDDLLQMPTGDRFLSSLLFRKFPPGEQVPFDAIVQGIPSDLVKGQYILSRMGSVRSYVEYANMFDKYGHYLVLDDQKQRAEAIAIKLADTKPGAEAIAFSFPDINGKEVSLASLKGKVVLVDLWATWCGPCKAEEPHWEELVDAYAGKDVVFLGISVDQDKAAWEKYVPEKQLKGVQLHAGPGNLLSEAYNVTGIPRYMLIDKEGKMIAAESPRPSNPNLRTILDEWIGK